MGILSRIFGRFDADSETGTSSSNHVSQQRRWGQEPVQGDSQDICFVPSTLSEIRERVRAKGIELGFQATPEPIEEGQKLEWVFFREHENMGSRLLAIGYLCAPDKPVVPDDIIFHLKDRMMREIFSDGIVISNGEYNAEIQESFSGAPIMLLHISEVQH